MAERFLRDRDGFILPLVGALVLPLMLLTGICYDLGRAWIVEHQLRSAAVAAAAVGAAYSEAPDRDDLIADCFDLNFRTKNPSVSVVGPDVDYAPGSDRVTVSVRAELKTVIMRLGGFDSMTITATGSAYGDSTAGTFVYSIAE
jgi:Flp pilus assembly protein TadG